MTQRGVFLAGRGSGWERGSWWVDYALRDVAPAGEAEAGRGGPPAHLACRQV